MRVEHIAIWTDNLERLKEFYITYLVQNQIKSIEMILKSLNPIFYLF